MGARQRRMEKMARQEKSRGSAIHSRSGDSAPLLHSARTGSVVVASGQVVGRLLGLLTTIILARNLSVAEFGIYNLLVGSVLILAVFTNTGLGSSLQRFVPEYMRTQQHSRLFKTFFFSESYRAVSGAIVGTVLIVCFPLYASQLKLNEYFLAVVLFLVGYVVSCQLEFLQVTFNGMLKQLLASLTDVMYMALRLLGVLLVVLLGVLLGARLVNVFIAELCAAVLVCATMWSIFLTRAYRPLRPKPGLDEPLERRRLARYSLLNAASMPGSFILSYSSDYLVIGAMASATQLGIYSLASRASQMLMVVMPPSLLQNIMRPVFYHRYYSVEEKEAELQRMFRFMVVFIASVLFPTVALAIIEADRILPFVFGSDFAAATPIFVLMMGFAIFTIVDLPSDLVLQATEMVQAQVYAQVFAVYNIVAAVLLLPVWGLMGVAFATGTAGMLRSLTWFFMARHHSRVSLPAWPLFKIVTNCAVAGVAAYVVGLAGKAVVWAFIGMVVGLLVYVAASAVNGFFNEGERQLVNRFLKRRVFRA